MQTTSIRTQSTLDTTALQGVSDALSSADGPVSVTSAAFPSGNGQHEPRPGQGPGQLVFSVLIRRSSGGNDAYTRIGGNAFDHLIEAIDAAGLDARITVARTSLERLS